MSNPSHRKTLARRLAAETGVSYQQARHQVDDAAAAGLLPSRLDDAGMAAALRILTTPPTPEHADNPPVFLDDSSGSITPEIGEHIREQVKDLIADQGTWDSDDEDAYQYLVTERGFTPDEAEKAVQESRVDEGDEPRAGKPTVDGTKVVHLLTGTGGVGLTKCGISITPENLDDTAYTIDRDEVTCPACADSAAGLREFEYRYVAYFTHTDTNWSAEQNNTDPATARQAIAEEILSYCAPLNPVLHGGIEEVRFAGTDLEDYASDPDEVTDTCFRIVFGSTIRATHSNPHTYGGLPDWEGSAQAIVDENSWENGAAHGWGFGFAVFLDIAEPGALPDEHRPTDK